VIALTTPPVPVDIARPPAAVTEIPPEVVPTGTGLSLYLSSERTTRCETPDTLLVPLRCVATRVQGGPGPEEHRRSYQGVFSADDVTSTAGKTWRIEAVHGENKNQFRNGVAEQNSIVPGVRVADCYSGVQPGAEYYTDCTPGYSAFFGITRTKTERLDNAVQDLGPVVWPRYGYSRDGERLSHGVYHPSMVRAGGYLYAVYYDAGRGEQRTHEGFRIARSRARDLGRRWSVWVEAEQRWVTSLPAGRRLSSPSPARSTPLFRTRTTGRTTVMTIARTTDRRFIGVYQELYEGPECSTGTGRTSTEHGRTWIRFSTTGTRWGRPIRLPGPDFAGCALFTESRMTYPKFLNRTGRTTKLVNPRRFSLIGTRYGGEVWRSDVTLEDEASPVS